MKLRKLKKLRKLRQLRKLKKLKTIVFSLPFLSFQGLDIRLNSLTP